VARWTGQPQECRDGWSGNTREFTTTRIGRIFLGDVVFVADVRGTQAGGFAVGDLLGEPMGLFANV